MSAVSPALGLPRRRALGWANRGATVVLVLVLALLALGVGLRTAGISTLVDYSGSMAPAIGAGDLVLDRGTVAAHLVPDQIATIPDPISGRLITHRVISVTRAGDDAVTVVTRGDANDASERWSLRDEAPVRRVIGHVPGAGRVVLWLSSPTLRLALAVLGGGLLLAGILRRVWSRG